MKTNKKGQAAMEFLMTYGWAILAAVIVIGVLAAFGVFSPSAFIPNSCIISAPLGCNAGTAQVADVTIEVRNGAGESIVLQNFLVEGCNSVGGLGAVATSGAGSTTTGAIEDLDDQELVVLTVTCDASLTSGKFQGDITATYSKTGSALNLTSTGKLVDEV